MNYLATDRYFSKTEIKSIEAKAGEDRAETLKNIDELKSNLNKIEMEKDLLEKKYIGERDEVSRVRELFESFKLSQVCFYMDN
jgi:hypothetical protein